MKQHPAMKLIASVVIFTFTITGLGITPETFASTGVPTLPLEVPLVKTGALAIPAELGQVTDQIVGTPSAPAFIHIQSAHGNYQAEKNIEKLLAYIENNSSVNLMFLEGASEKLQPEMFRIFQDHPEFNRKVTDRLVREGFLTGPENFLINQRNGFSETDAARPSLPSPVIRFQESAVQAFGVEDLAAYKNDRDAFISVIRADKTAQAHLLKLRAAIDRRFASKLNKNLLDIVRQEEAVGNGTISFESWLKTLGDASKKHLKQDLSDAFFQKQYPFLIRYFRLQAIGSGINREKAHREAKSFIAYLSGHKVPSEIIESFTAILQLPESDLLKAANRTTDGYSTLRRAFDNTFEKLPKNFSLKPWPNWMLYSQYVILMQEMEGKGLQDETVLLKDQIESVLARTPAEMEYLRQSRHLYLLRRLFSLELTRAEYDELRASQCAKITEQSKTNSKSRPPLPKASAKQPIRVRGDQEMDLHLRGNDINPVFEQAMSFYRTAVIREQKMFANALKKMTATKQQRAVIVTGGFHAEGLKKLASEKGCSYIQITPHINEVSKRDRAIYLRSMLGSRDISTSQAVPLLGANPIEDRVFVTGKQQTESWRSEIRELIANEINTGDVSARSELIRSLSGSVFGSPSSTISSARISLSESRSPAKASGENLTPDQEMLFQKALRDLKSKWWELAFWAGIERRTAAAKYLGEAKDPRAVPALIKGLGDWRVRDSASHALSELARTTGDALAIEASDAYDDEERQKAEELDRMGNESRPGSMRSESRLAAKASGESLTTVRERQFRAVVRNMRKDYLLRFAIGLTVLIGMLVGFYFVSGYFSRPWFPAAAIFCLPVPTILCSALVFGGVRSGYLSFWETKKVKRKTIALVNALRMPGNTDVVFLLMQALNDRHIRHIAAEMLEETNDPRAVLALAAYRRTLEWEREKARPRSKIGSFSDAAIDHYEQYDNDGNPRSESRLTSEQERQLRKALSDVKRKWSDSLLFPWKTFVFFALKLLVLLGRTAIGGLLGFVVGSALAAKDTDAIHALIVIGSLYAFGFWGDITFINDAAYHSRDSRVRNRRIDAIQVLSGLKDVRAVSALTRLLEDESSGVRANAIHALLNLNALSELAKKLSSSYPEVRRAAVDAHFARKDFAELGKELNNPFLDVRAAAISALQHINAFAELGANLNSEYSDVRMAAAEALGMLNGPDSIVALKKLLKDPDKRVRVTAITALANCRDQKTLFLMLSILKSIDPGAAIKFQVSGDTLNIPALSDCIKENADRIALFDERWASFFILINDTINDGRDPGAVKELTILLNEFEAWLTADGFPMRASISGLIERLVSMNAATDYKRDRLTALFRFLQNFQERSSSEVWYHKIDFDQLLTQVDQILKSGANFSVYFNPGSEAFLVPADWSNKNDPGSHMEGEDRPQVLEIRPIGPLNRSEARLSDAKIEAVEIKDSRGKPTVRAVISLGGITVSGDVPAGSSTGEREANTVATDRAIEVIRLHIAPMIRASGLDLRKHEDLLELERRISLNAGENFKVYGANATVPVSWALWKLAAALQGMELDQYIRKFEPDAVYDNPEPTRFLMNIYNGGLHALKPGETLGKDRIDIQEIMIVPVGPRAATYRGALEMGDKIDAALKKILTEEFGAATVTRADEAGFSVKGLGSSSAAIERVFRAIKDAGYAVGTDVQLALDVAASSFLVQNKASRYDFQGLRVDSRAMIRYYDSLVKQHPGAIRSIEDGLGENDWNSWVRLTRVMNRSGISTIGDDLFVTQLASLNKGIELSAASDILIKVNQNGTVSGTLDVIKRAKSQGMKVIVSHRSGETLSHDIASLAYAVRASGLKTGDPQPGYDFGPGGEYANRPLVRRAKYQKMLALEDRDAKSGRSEARVDPDRKLAKAYPFLSKKLNERVGGNWFGRLWLMTLLTKKEKERAERALENWKDPNQQKLFNAIDDKINIRFLASIVFLFSLVLVIVPWANHAFGILPALSAVLSAQYPMVATTVLGLSRLMDIALFLVIGVVGLILSILIFFFAVACLIVYPIALVYTYVIKPRLDAAEMKAVETHSDFNTEKFVLRVTLIFAAIAVIAGVLCYVMGWHGALDPYSGQGQLAQLVDGAFRLSAFVTALSLCFWIFYGLLKFEKHVLFPGGRWLKKRAGYLLRPITRPAHEYLEKLSEERKLSKAVRDIRPRWWDGRSNNNGIDRMTSAAENLRYSDDPRVILGLLDVVNAKNDRLRNVAVNLIVHNYQYSWADAADSRAVPGLIMALNDKDQRVVFFAMNLLAKLKDANAVIPLLEVLKKGNDFVRVDAATALAEFNDARAVPGLIDAMKDPYKKVRLCAINSLVKLFISLGQLNDRRVVPELIAALQDADKEVKISAIEALCMLKDPRAVLPLLNAVGNLKDKLYRDKIEPVLYEIVDPGHVQPLVQLLNSSDDFNADLVVKLLRRLNDARSVLPLLEVLKNKDSACRRHAISALDHFHDLRSAPALIEVLTNGPSDIRVAATTALGSLNDISVIRALIDALKKAPSDVRVAAAIALGRLKALDAFGDLMVTLKASDQSVLAAAVRALGELGDFRAVAELMQILDHYRQLPATAENRALSDTVAAALKKINDPRAASLLNDYEIMRAKEKAVELENERIRQEEEWERTHTGSAGSDIDTYVGDYDSRESDRDEYGSVGSDYYDRSEMRTMAAVLLSGNFLSGMPSMNVAWQALSGFFSGHIWLTQVHWVYLVSAVAVAVGFVVILKSYLNKKYFSLFLFKEDWEQAMESAGMSFSKIMKILWAPFWVPIFIAFFVSAVTFFIVPIIAIMAFLEAGPGENAVLMQYLNSTLNLATIFAVISIVIAVVIFGRKFVETVRHYPEVPNLTWSEEALIGALDSKDKIRAARVLGEIKSKAAVPYLVKLLGESRVNYDREVFANALLAIGDPLGCVHACIAYLDFFKYRDWARNWLVSAGAYAVPTLIETVAANIQNDQAVSALSEIGDPRALPVLLHVIQKGKGKSIPYAAKGLARLRDPRAIPVLIERIVRVSGEPIEDRAVAEALLSFNDPRGVVPAQIAFLQTSTKPQDSIKELVASGSAAVPGLIRLLNRDLPSSVHAAMALAGIGTRQATDALVSGLSSKSSDVRRHAAVALGGTGSAKFVPDLLPVLNDENDLVRDTVALALGTLKDAAAAPALIEQLRRPTAAIASALLAIAPNGLQPLHRYLEWVLNPPGYYKHEPGTYDGLSATETGIIIHALKNSLPFDVIYEQTDEKSHEQESYDYYTGASEGTYVVIDQRAHLKATVRAAGQTDTALSHKAATTPLTRPGSVTAQVPSKSKTEMADWELKTGQFDFAAEGSRVIPLATIMKEVPERNWLWNYIGNHEPGGQDLAAKRIDALHGRLLTVHAMLVANGFVTEESPLVSLYLTGSYPWRANPNDLDLIVIVAGDHPFQYISEQDLSRKAQKVFSNVSVNFEIVGLETLKKAVRGESVAKAQVVRRKAVAYSGAIPLAGVDVFKGQSVPRGNYEIMRDDLLQDAAAATWKDIRPEPALIEAKRAWRNTEANAMSEWITRQFATRSESRQLSVLPKLAHMTDRSGLVAKIGSAINVGANTVSPLFVGTNAYAAEMEPALFAGTEHFQAATVLPFIFAKKWPVFDGILRHTSSVSSERMVIDQRQGVPDAASVLPLVTFAQYNPKAVVVLALIAKASEVAAFEMMLAAMCPNGILPRNFKVQTFADEGEFVAEFNEFYNSSVPFGRPVALVTDRDQSAVTQKIGSKRSLLSVIGDLNPLKQTASVLLAADKLLDNSIWEQAYHFVSIAKLGGVDVLVTELANFIRSEARIKSAA